MKKKVLFFADGISTAHPTRMEALVDQLDTDQFEISFATPEHFFDLLSVKEKGIQTNFIHSLSNSYFTRKLFEARCPWSSESLDAQLKEDLELIDQVRPDMIVGDTRLSLIAACRKVRIPYFNLVNYHWIPTYPKPKLVPYIQPVEMFGRMLSSLLAGVVTPFLVKRHITPLNDWSKRHGVGDLNSLYDFYSQGNTLLFPDLPQNFEHAKCPPNGNFIGPLIWKSQKIPWPKSWPKLSLKEKYAYLSMGSTGTNKVLPILVQGLIENGYTVLLSGSNNPISPIKHEKLLFAPFLPTDEVLKFCQFAICNGGTGSTYHFLKYKIPFLNVPTNFDQYLNVDRLKAIGLSDYCHQDQLKLQDVNEKIHFLSTSEKIKENLALTARHVDQIVSEKRINQILLKGGV